MLLYMKIQIGIFILILLIIPQTMVVYAESYNLEIDEHTFNISYTLDGSLIAMAIDPELTSLLIGTENVADSLFEIEFDNTLISAEKNEFAVLVNGLQVDYEIEIKNDHSVLRFYIFDGTEEIEIIGTNVIPEFPFGPFFVLVFLIGFVTLVVKTKSFFLSRNFI